MMQFLENIETQRIGLIGKGTLNINGVIGVSILHFVKGQYHFYAYHYPIIIALVLWVFYIANYNQRKLLMAALAVLYLFSLIHVIVDWNVLKGFLLKVPILNALSLRFYSLLPLIWFLLFSFSIKLIINYYKLAYKYILSTVFSLQFCIIFFPEITSDYQGCQFIENAFYYTYLDKSSDQHNNFAVYTKDSLFRKIKSIIPPKTRVGFLGVDPIVAQFNGYYTVGGYYNYYPKYNRRLVDRINDKEYFISKEVKYGNRANLVSSDYENGKRVIENPQWNYVLMDSLNVKYVVSTRKINANELVNNGKYYHHNDTLFVYKLSIK